MLMMMVVAAAGYQRKIRGEMGIGSLLL